MRLNIDKEHKELKSHGNYAFPVLVSDERLSWFDTGEFPWHWHPEIELTIVLDGNMTYLVNDNGRRRTFLQYQRAPFRKTLRCGRLQLFIDYLSSAPSLWLHIQSHAE